MAVIITGYVDAIRLESPSVIIKNNGFTRIALPTVVDYRINVYGRYYSVQPPALRFIDVSLDNITYTTSAKINVRELDDPTYDLLFTFTGPYTDIWVRPTDNTFDVMLGDTKSQTPDTDPYNDYPYNYSTPYQYSIHNGVPISGNVDLYFQISSAP
jgi:hypothetical protein